MHQAGAEQIRDFLKRNRRLLERSGIGIPSTTSEIYEYADEYDSIILSEPSSWIDRSKDIRVWKESYGHMISCLDDQWSIRPVIYLRAQDEYVLELWKKMVLSPGNKAVSFRQLVDDCRMKGSFDYHMWLEEAENVFGRDSMILRIYNAEYFSEGDIGRDLLSAIGAEYRPGYIPSSVKDDRPVTVSAANALCLIRQGTLTQYNELSDFEALKSAAITFSKMYPESGMTHIMDPQERAALMENCRESNRRVAERYLDGSPLFEEKTSSYDQWTKSHEECVKDAETVIRLSKTSNELKGFMDRYLALEGRGVAKIESDAPARLQWWRRLEKELEEKHELIQPVEYVIDDDKKLIYIVNSKVANTSIKYSMSDEDHPDDYSIHTTMLQRGKSVYELRQDQENYYKFTFVRNPFSRLVSCYESKYHTDKNMYGLEKLHFDRYLGGYLSKDEGFERFIKKVCEIPCRLMDRHIRLQYDIVYDEDGKCRCDHIGKYENIDEDFEKIRTRFDLRSLPRYNSSGISDWMKYYTVHTARIVYEKYEPDIVSFGYEEDYDRLMDVIT